MKTLPLLALLISVSSVGCDENLVGPTAITNVTWKLESVERSGMATITVPNPEQFTMRFETNGELSVRADCNSCGGRYTLDGASLSIRNMACTLIACPSPGLDSTFTAALSNVRTVTITGGQLVITGTDFTLRFRS